MTYKEIMDKIFKLEMQLNSTTKDLQKKQLQNEIAKLKSRVFELEKKVKALGG